jgi:hypothetical protein
MKITKRQLRRIIKEEKKRILRESPRYMDSSQEKAAVKAAAAETGNTIDSLQMLIDLNYHRFTEEENNTLEQAIDILNDILYKR